MVAFSMHHSELCYKSVIDTVPSPTFLIINRRTFIRIRSPLHQLKQASKRADITGKNEQLLTTVGIFIRYKKGEASQPHLSLYNTRLCLHTRQTIIDRF